MTLNPKTQALIDASAAAGTPPVYLSTVEQARAAVPGLSQLLGPGPDVERVREAILTGKDGGTFTARLFVPTAGTPLATVVYFHGGGWVMNGLEAFDPMCRHLALKSECQVLSVDYRVAPEHPFPVPLEDCHAATLWAAENLISSTGKLVLLGDSSGANLAAVVAQIARDDGSPEITLQVLAYPPVDADFTRPSYGENTENATLLGKDMAWFWDHYLPEVSQRSDPRAAPIRGNLAGLPRAYVMVAQYDPLRDEGLAYAEALRAAGVATTYKLYEDQSHGFFIMVNYLDAANEAVDEVARMIRDEITA
jgi:acetyl esterase